jgi:hypothetical protein
MAVSLPFIKKERKAFLLFCHFHVCRQQAGDVSSIFSTVMTGGL